MLERTIYGQEHEIFRAAIRSFIEKELKPYHEQWEKEHIVPREFWRKAGAQGILCPQVPEAYGGPGGDYRFLPVVIEEMFYAGGSGPGFGVHSDIVGGYLLNHGSEAQKRAWLPRMVTGEAIGAIAMTEPDAGSDLQGIRTTARREGDEYVINGAKTFISNGQNADVVIVAAKTDVAAKGRGISLLLVETDRPGFRRGRNLDKVGLRAQDTSELFFDDVRVPRANLLGEEGAGFVILMRELPQERLAIAASAMASAQRAFDLTAEYVKERRAFGQAIGQFQNTRFKLAEMKTELAAGWSFLDNCIRHHVEGKLSAADAAMAKLWTTEMQGRVVDGCVQLHGGYGYMLEYPIARLYLDTRVQRIHGGTSEIMKEVIARSI